MNKTRKPTKTEALLAENTRLREALDRATARRAQLADELFYLLEDHIRDLVEDYR